MTVTVNIGGDSKAWQAIVTGTKLTELIVTGTVQPGSGNNLTAPPGTVYQYISLVPARYTSITKAVINFTVPQSWLDENHIDPRSIVLYHQTANGWVALPTTVLSTKDGTVYFSAQSAGFSLFAIAGTPGASAPAIKTAATSGGTAEVQATTRAIAASAPVAAQTTAPPAAPAKPAVQSPFMNIVLVIAAIGVLAGGGWYVRRWWIRRQNPALFTEYD
jgi:PGF-pre-PGF domain-containing protein